MALTLIEAAKLEPKPLRKGVLETFVQLSPVLDRMPFMNIEGNALAYNEEATLPGVAFRGINEGYEESTGTVNQKTETLKILGGDADVDNFIQQTGSNLNDQRATQTVLKIKAMSYGWQKEFFKGDVAVNPKGFDGLQKRLIGNQVLDAGTNGLPMLGAATDAEIFKVLDLFDELLALVPGINDQNGVIYMNGQLLPKFRSLMRRLKIDAVVEADIAGKRALTWNGVPIHDAGNDAAGIPILGQTETIGTATNTSSIYAVKYGDSEGEQAVTGITNGGMQVRDLGELETKPSQRTRIEFFAGTAVFGGKAAARLRGVLNA